jgi:hypothetical protein
MARTLFYGDHGLDYVFSDDTDYPGVDEVIQLIKDRVKIAGSHIPMLVKAKLTESQRQQVLNAFPGYKRCFRESIGLVMLDSISDE